MYQLDFDHEMKDDDQVFEDNGVKVVVTRRASSTSWEPSCATAEASTERGLSSTPNANRTCGCGESFSL